MAILSTELFLLGYTMPLNIPSHYEFHFQPHLLKFIFVFFDDILIYSPTWELHMEHVRTT